jgi:hypothetical protein
VNTHHLGLNSPRYHQCHPGFAALPSFSSLPCTTQSRLQEEDGEESEQDALFVHRLQPNNQIWPNPFLEADQKKLTVVSTFFGTTVMQYSGAEPHPRGKDISAPSFNSSPRFPL